MDGVMQEITISNIAQNSQVIQTYSLGVATLNKYQLSFVQPIAL